MNGVKVTKTVVSGIQVGQNPRHVCLTEGVVGSTCHHRLSSAAAVQQCSRQGLALCPRSCLGIGGHASGSRQGDPAVHWGLKSRKAVAGLLISDSRYTANMVAEHVVEEQST